MADFVMPSLGADMEEATLVAWHIKPGDHVRRGQIVADVDTAKGVIEIECFMEGIVEALLASEGTTLPVGAPLARIASAATAELATPPASDAPPGTRAAPPMPVPRPTQPATRQKISPRARKRAADLHVDVARLRGTGSVGEITMADVEAAATAAAPEAVPPTIGKPSEASIAGDSQTRLRSAIAAAMAKSKREIPHYYLQTTIDLARANAWLNGENQRRPMAKRLLPAVIYLKALARALRDVPQLNGFWIDGHPVPSAAIHIGFAISMRGGGLVAPALHNVDEKSLDTLMADLHDLVPRARNGPLRSSEMTDATITLTSLGDLGVDAVWGVIYPPQVAIVGLGRTQPRPWVENGQLTVRPALTATLAADHRASDGMVGARLLDALQRHLQQPETL